MISAELKRLAGEAGLEATGRFRLRLAFGLACVSRVEHLLVDPQIQACLGVGRAYLAGEQDRAAVEAAAGQAMTSARGHPGSNSLDGSGSAAVSASYGVANALAGRALAAAEYAAYASVYAYSSSAVTDPEAYRDEQTWQLDKLRTLLAEVTIEDSGG